MTTATQPVAQATRLKLVIRGAVQGVGFRPFVFRLATELGLAGKVTNSAQGVFIEAEGSRDALEQFLLRLERERPPRSFIQSLEASWLDAMGYEEFEICESAASGEKTALVLPDIATCPDCLREISDPANRRYRYPFTNCTNCGPRFSIIESLPYDRANTSMKSFKLCPACEAEYHHPRDRRFHAQPNACPECGPALELWSRDGEAMFGGHEALLAAAHTVRRGGIVAVKGIGGFHLLVDARNDAAVRRLRERKHREEKPFALLFPSLKSVKGECEVSPAEARLLLSPEAPIVLLRQIGNRQSAIGHSVAPGNPTLGVMLPSNPLHHLLMAELAFPVVATSGNLSDEPICTDEPEALERLRGVADLFLVHNRPIVRHVDDSIVRLMLGRELVLRRARGYAPLPIMVGTSSTTSQISSRNGAGVERAPTVLAVGAHLKNAVALSVGNQVFVSQHIGDLETVPANEAFQRVIGDFESLYETNPTVIAADLHPDYLSTKFASQRLRQPEGGEPRLIQVQHHIAHVLSCMAENELEPPVLGVAWDGTGYGPDGTIWGGEFFLVTDESIERIAHLRPFPLPSGDAAVKEPRRAVLGLLHELKSDPPKFGLLNDFRNGGDAPRGVEANRQVCPTIAEITMQHKVVPAFSPAELATLETMLSRKLNCPLTSSMGRLFDAVASLIGLRHQMRFEGQAAMELESALDGIVTDEAYPFAINRRPSPMQLDWSPMIEAILEDVTHGVSTGEISAKFHNALAEAIVAVARLVGEPHLALSGGCFQNCYLTERTVGRLREEGFQPYWHQRVPPNDGGIALGQVMSALRADRCSRTTHHAKR